MENIKLTPKEAINQGYKYYVYPDDGYQCLKEISDMDMDFDKEPMACEKSPTVFLGIDKDEIRELLSDHVFEQWNELTGDDSDDVHDLFKELDFSDVEKMIQDKLKSLRYYRQSNIELINP